MDDIMKRIVIEPSNRFFDKVLEFLPHLLMAILILITGIILAMILKGLFSRFFRVINLDRFSERAGLMEMLRKGGIKESASNLLAKIIGWLTIVVFIILSVRALDVPAVERILEKFFLYMPNIFVAALILFFGYLLSNFFGRAALIASVNAGLKVSGLIGKLVKITVFLLSITMALEQLGIGRGTIVVTFAIVFGGIVLALAIAFGLGGKDVAREYLEKKLRGEEEKDDIEHL
ncbi:MAG: hypothetical protein HZC12_01130 [Nitrospirae bacterium]|nr:hypothetical protein [Nitrospirota bacterium]